MSISKSVGTVAGVANTGIVSLAQYGIRSKIEIQSSATFSSTHRASSGGTRTVTLSEDHGLIAGDLILVGGFGSSSYNLSGAVIVTNVPASNKVSYSSTSLNETETADTGGTVIKLGFRTLRLACRWATITEASVSSLFGFGLSQGEYPVSANNCAFHIGVRPTDLTYSSGILTTGNGIQLSAKTNATWAQRGSVAGVAKYGASRQNPALTVLDFYGSKTVLQLTKINVPPTRDMMLSVLRSATIGATDSGVTFDLSTTQSESVAWALHSAGPDFYVEAYNQLAETPVEIYDIGYSYF